jgi:tRNA A37 threonylcarbamoyltransferase TsaD
MAFPPACVPPACRRLTLLPVCWRSLLALGRETGLRVLFPPPELCTDNAAMIGNAAVHRLRNSLRLNALDDVLPRRKWSLRDVTEPAPSI